MKRTTLKSLIAFVAIGLCAFTANAQGVYVNLNLGYGFGMGSSTVNDYTYVQKTPGYTSTSNNKDLSFGKGLNFGGAIGYMFNKNVGLELGLSYLMGGTTETTNNRTYNSSSNYSTENLSATMFRINPTFVITAGLDKINPYAKFGMIVGMGTITNKYESTQTNTSSGNTTTDIELQTTKYNGGLAIGFNSGVGVLFSLSNNISLFGEINMVNLSYAPTNGEVIEYSENGANKLSDWTTRDKKTEFVDNYNYDSEASVSDASPRTAQKNKLPFGSFGVNFGIKISL